jgi:ABC-type branched-subunit amino acid transport system substrate-binding protein
MGIRFNLSNISKVQFIAFRLACLFILLQVAASAGAQGDSTYRVALVLPFQCEVTAGKLDEILNAKDLYSANHVRFNDDAIIALDFYQGLKQALAVNPDNLKVELNVYDSWGSDSVTAELLKNPALKLMDCIIGSVSTSTSRLVADFCKQNKILNIQPFTPSRSLTSENPYHLKLAPTIEAHIDNLFQSILDSFPIANVVIYTPKNERSMPLAMHFDSLFINYNTTAENKYPVALLNTTDQTVDGEKKDVQDLIIAGRTNILIVTSYDEPFVQSALRAVYEKIGKADIIVYGMPTWLSGEVLRLDYINNLHTRISDAFWADTTKPATKAFIDRYEMTSFTEPSKYAFLGYDVMNFITGAVKAYGKDFIAQITTQRYTGTGFKFDILPNMKSADTINYYENTHVNVLKVEDYQLKKVW